MLRDLSRLALASVAGGLLLGGYATLRIWQQGERDERRPVDAIVVLGAAQYDGRPSPLFRARLDHAVSLYIDGLAPTLIVTGGKAEGDRTTEAAVARRYAIQHGVPESAILVEDKGRTTLESLRTVASMFRQRGFVTGLFVSDRPHLLRVLRMARDQGIQGYGSPTTTSPIEHDLGLRIDATIHELGALGVYFLTGEAPAPLDALPTSP